MAAANTRKFLLGALDPGLIHRSRDQIATLRADVAAA